MKEKIAMTGGGCSLQTGLPLGCWKPICRQKKSVRKWYQKQIETVLASVAVGLMFLTGLWMFLVQLAEYGS